MDITLSIRLPERLHTAVADQAIKEERSVAAIIRIALRLYLAEVTK